MGILYQIPGLLQLFVLFAPSWFPVVRLCLVAPFRRGERPASAGCVLAYALSTVVATGGPLCLLWFFEWTLPSGVLLVPFVFVSWGLFAIGLALDPFVGRRERAKRPGS